MGRKAIYTNVDKITADNIVEVLDKAMSEHNVNSSEINFLYEYYKGKQNIQAKTKEVRQDINNIITINRAYEIVSFKKGYIFGEPVQYISSGEEKDISDKIKKLNDYMDDCDKSELDSKLAEWFLIGGVAYRMCLSRKVEDEDEAPFRIRTLDPRKTFIVRYNNLDEEVAMGVTYTEDSLGAKTSYIYTKDKYYVVDSTKGLISVQDHYLGRVPIIEYVHNEARMGAFEPVLPILDAINSIQSNRLDDLEQHVNSILAIFGAEMTEETYKQVQEWKMLVMPDGSEAKNISSPLQQTDIQSFVDDLYNMALSICGVPRVENNTGGGDNGVAVHLRSGWEQSETQAKAVEKTFKKSEKDLLRLVFKILKVKSDVELKLSNINIKFARRYTDNILTKAQMLMNLLDVGIEPSIAIATCGIWNDPMDVYIQSKKYLAKWEIEEEEEVEDVLQTPRQEIDEIKETN